MLTILLRHTVVNVRHRSTISLNYGQSILVRKFLCTSVQRQAHLPQLSPYDVSLFAPISIVNVLILEYVYFVI